MTTRKMRASEVGTLIGVRLQPAELAQIDGWRKTQADIPTRPEAIRRLLAETLGKPTGIETIAARDLNAKNDEAAIPETPKGGSYDGSPV